MKIDSKNYMVIHGWMRTELNLSGNDLLVYAIIFGFSQLEHHSFNGSLQYLADWCGATKQGIQKNLKNLMDKNLIKKEITTINGVNSVAYYATELHRGTTLLHGYTTELHGGIQLSCTNNISNKKEDNKEDIKEKSKEKKSEFLKHSKSTEFKIDGLIDLYINTCTKLPKVRVMTDSRKSNAEKIYKKYGLDAIKEVFEIANNSSFLTGDNDRNWKASFDFIMREDKFIAILEGKYNSHSKREKKFADEGLKTCINTKPRKERVLNARKSF